MEDFKLFLEEDSLDDNADCDSSMTEAEADSTTNIVSQPQTNPSRKTKLTPKTKLSLKTKYFNNCIILGKKPSKNKNEDFTKKVTKNCFVDLNKIDDFLHRNSNRYCLECKILFHIAKDFDVHKRNVHSYYIEDINELDIKARKYKNDLDVEVREDENVLDIEDKNDRNNLDLEAKNDEKTRFSCSYCDIQMATEFGLQKHINWIHGNFVLTKESEVTTVEPKDNEQNDMESVDDEQNDMESVDDEQNDMEAIDNELNNIESIENEPNNMEFIVTVNIKAEDIKQDPNSIESVENQLSNATSVENETSSLECAENVGIKNEPMEYEPNNMESVENVDIKTEPMTCEPVDIASVENKQRNTNSVENQQPNTRSVENERNNEPNNMESVENVDIKTEPMACEPVEIESVENKQRNTNSVENQQPNTRSVENERNNTKSVENQQPNTRSVENEQNNTKSVENRQHDTRSVENERNNTKSVENQQPNTRSVENERNNTKSLENQQPNTKSVENERNNTKSVENRQPNTRSVDNERNNTKSVENQQPNTRSVENERNNNKKSVENQQHNSKSVENKRNNTKSVKNQQNNSKSVENKRNNSKSVENEQSITLSVENEQSITLSVENEQNCIDSIENYQNSIELVSSANVEPEPTEESTSSEYFPSKPTEPCSICHELFPTKEDLIQHIYKDHLKSFPCDVCSQMFTTKEKYQEHLLDHNNENSNEDRLIYRCFCGCQFSLFKAYVNHFRNFHKNHNGKLNITKSKIEFQCRFCPRIYEQLNVYNRHIMQNHNENNNEDRLIYRCFCGCQFSLFSSYVTHFRNFHKNHNGKLNFTKSKIEFACRYCPKICDKLNVYNRHIMHNHNPNLNLDKKFNDKNCAKVLKNKLVVRAGLKKNTLITRTMKTSKSNNAAFTTNSNTKIVDNDKTEVKHVTENRKTLKLVTKQTDISNDNLISNSYVIKTDAAAENNDKNIEFYFCNTCETYFDKKKFHMDIHEKFWCLKKPRTMCNICGLHMSSTKITEHKKLHTESNLTLKDFKFFCARTQQTITPPTPDLPSCRRCKLHFNSKALRNFHSDKVCKNDHQIKARTCQLCHKDFTSKAYLMHMAYHEIESDNHNESKRETASTSSPVLASKITVGKKKYVFHQCQSCKLCVQDPQTHFKCSVKLSEKCKHCNLHFDKDHSELHAIESDLNKDTIKIVPFTKIGPRRHIDNRDKVSKYTLYKCRLCEMCVASYALARKHEDCNGHCTSWKTKTCDKCGYKFYCRTFVFHYDKHLNFPDMTTENIKIIKFGRENKTRVLSPRNNKRRASKLNK